MIVEEHGSYTNKLKKRLIWNEVNLLNIIYKLWGQNKLIKSK
jgi:hypothetical protein